MSNEEEVFVVCVCVCTFECVSVCVCVYVRMPAYDQRVFVCDVLFFI